jgi:hypothetical protein
MRAVCSLVAGYLKAIGLDYPYTLSELDGMWDDASDGDDSDGELLLFTSRCMPPRTANNLHNNDLCGD